MAGPNRASGSPTATDRIKAAVAGTCGAGTARFLYTSRCGSPLAKDVTRLEGEADLSRRLARGTLHNIPHEFDSEMQAKMDEPAADPEEEEARLLARGFLKMFSMPRDHVYAGGITYTRVGDEGWADFSGGDRDGPRADDDPFWLLDALVGVRDDAEETGTADVRGAPVTHFRLTIDLEAADAGLETGIIAPGPRAYRSLRELPAEVWIDDRGLIRRMSYLSSFGSAGDHDYWHTTEIWDFGVDVQISVPAAHELIAPSGATDHRAPENERH